MTYDELLERLKTPGLMIMRESTRDVRDGSILIGHGMREEMFYPFTYQTPWKRALVEVGGGKQVTVYFDIPAELTIWEDGDRIYFNKKLPEGNRLTTYVLQDLNSLDIGAGEPEHTDKIQDGMAEW